MPLPSPHRRPITGTVCKPPPRLTTDRAQPSATAVARDLQNAGAEAKTMFSRPRCCYCYCTGSNIFLKNIL